MIVRSISNLLSRKIITLPQLSPTHTSARIVQRLVPSGSHVIEYQPVMTVQCSSDMIADPADRPSPEHQSIMLLEVMEEGVLQWNSDFDNSKSIDESQWLKVGTILGSVSDDEDNDDVDDADDADDWHWQAYLHDKNDEEETEYMKLLKEKQKQKAD